MGEHSGRTPTAAGTLVAGRYELVGLLGTGGMAQVWAADDRLLSRRVAVKLLHPHLAEDPSFVQRFRREAVSAARLVHPSIVAVYDTVSAPGCEAIVMELVDGVTLREYLDRHGALPEQRVREIGRDLSSALDCAHRNGVVHRDIKPANILLTEDGSVRLADFGIAKAEEDPDLTVAGTLVGTAAYLAPEQVGGGVVDQRTDLYSLSTVLYEALSGQTPFRGDSPAATALARLHQEPADLADVVRGAGSALCTTVMRNLQRAPERRFQSAVDFGAALDASARSGSRRRTSGPASTSGPSSAARTATEPDAQQRARRRVRARSPRPRRPVRSIAGRIVMALLIGAPLALVVALLLEPAPSRTNPGPDSEPEVRTMILSEVASFDPQGDNGVENEDDAANAIDGDPATVWRTEGYNSQTFDTKPGVGLVVGITSTAPLDTLTIDGSAGWKGLVYVLADRPAADTPPPVTGGVAVDATNVPVSVDLEGAEGRYVLVWITDLGLMPVGETRHRVTIADIRLTGRVVRGG